MILTDAGPLVALVDRRDPHHDRCHAVAKTFPDGALLTTLPCLTEAMYMVGEAGGYHSQALLWELRARGDLLLHTMTTAEIDRAEVLMEKFKDSPMDFGDASLVAVAESRSLRKVFTLDRHFWGYRLADGSALEPVPGPRL
jgi:predicted nucleic acid-binding protein